MPHITRFIFLLKRHQKAVLSGIGVILVLIGLFIPTIASTFTHVSIYHQFHSQALGLIAGLTLIPVLVFLNAYVYHLGYALLMSTAINMLYTTAYGNNNFWADVLKGTALTSKFSIFFSPVFSIAGKSVGLLSDLLAETLLWRGYGWEVLYAGALCILIAGSLQLFEIAERRVMKRYLLGLFSAALLGFISGRMLVSSAFALSVVGGYAFALTLGFLPIPKTWKIAAVVIPYLWIFYPRPS